MINSIYALMLAMTPVQLQAYINVCEIGVDEAIAAQDRDAYVSTVREYAERGGLTSEEAQDLYAVCTAYEAGIAKVLNEQRRNLPRT